MWFKKLIQGGKTRPGGYLSKMQETFADPYRESSMAYWERLQGHTKITEWKHVTRGEKEEEDEQEEIKHQRTTRKKTAAGRVCEKDLLMEDEEQDMVRRMPRLYKNPIPKIIAARKKVYGLLKDHGLINAQGRAEPDYQLVELDDEEIVRYYAQVAQGILDYFKCCDNFKEIKRYVDYHVRFSCLFTLSRKYDEHPQDTYKRFSKELLLTVEGEDGVSMEKQFYPSSHEIRKMIKGYSAKSLFDVYCPVK